MSNMPNQSSGSHSNVVDTLRELEDHLDLAIRESGKETGSRPGGREAGSHVQPGQAINEARGQSMADQSPNMASGELRPGAGLDQTGIDQQTIEPSADQSTEQNIDQNTDQQAEAGTLKEQAIEQYMQVDENRPEESPYVVRKATTTKDDQAQQAQPSKEQADIENILAADLSHAYRQMNPEQQEAFRKKGEETAAQIVSLMERAKITVRKVLMLIKNWLQLIPGVNQFFLEQEMKIKAEEVLRYEREYNRKQKS